jgi:hypothetical protein
MLSIHLRLSLPTGLFPSGFPTNIIHASLFRPIRDERFLKPEQKSEERHVQCRLSREIYTSNRQPPEAIMSDT